MVQAVTAKRLTGGGVVAASVMVVGSRSHQVLEELGHAARMAGVDAELDAHADTQRRLALGVVDAHAQGNALYDLDPVAAAVLGRQQRKARRRSRADALDRAGPALAGIGIDLDGRVLAG